MSGFFGEIIGGVMSSGIAGQVAPMAGVLAQLLGSAEGATSGTGGIGALITQFEAAGLGAHISSWIGSGENMPVSPEQISQVFPPGQVAQWAAETGTTPEVVLAVLAHALPHAVDHATPEGKAETAQLPDLGGLLGRLFSGGR